MNPTTWPRKGDQQSSSGMAFVLTLVLLAVVMAVTVALSGSRGANDAPAATESTSEHPDATAQSRRHRAARWIWRRAMSSLT